MNAENQMLGELNARGRGLTVTCVTLDCGMENKTFDCICAPSYILAIEGWAKQSLLTTSSILTSPYNHLSTSILDPISSSLYLPLFISISTQACGLQKASAT